MNVICVFEVFLVFHSLTFAASLQNIFQPKPELRKTFHYEVFHPKLSESVTKAYNAPLELSTPFSSLLSTPKFRPQPPPLVPDILNNIFEQAPSVLKEVANNFLPEHFFTPNTNNELAATLGQIENYKKDLEEQAKEEKQERDRLANRYREPELLRSREPKLFVSVNSGLYNYNYTI